MAQGAQAVGAWVLKRMKAEWAKQKNMLCKNADKLYAKLKAKGAALPKQSKWDGLSCDQKLAFIVALGPYGASMLVAGALVGGFATDAAKEFQKYGKDAAKKLGSAGKDFSDAVSNVTSGVTVSVPKVRNPFGGLGCETGDVAMRLGQQDVDFGYLGNFGVVASGSGTQRRGDFAGLGYGPMGAPGVPAPPPPMSAAPAPSYMSYVDQAIAAAKKAEELRKALRGSKPSGKTSSPAQAQYAPPRQGGGSALPSWALPVGVGVIALGAIALFASKRR